jgi:hypothetical protein
MSSESKLNPQSIITDFGRPPPPLSGEKGTKFIEHAWHDIKDALRKDVPEVLTLTNF